MTRGLLEETRSFPLDMISIEQIRAFSDNRPEPLLSLHERPTDYVLAVDMQKIKGNIGYRNRLGENSNSFQVFNAEASLEASEVRYAIFSEDNDLSINDRSLCLDSI